MDSTTTTTNDKIVTLSSAELWRPIRASGKG